MMPNLTRDVLVHTWDLARAVGADDRTPQRPLGHAARPRPIPNLNGHSGLTNPLRIESVVFPMSGVLPGADSRGFYEAPHCRDLATLTQRASPDGSLTWHDRLRRRQGQARQS
jgi:hypothetical protein